MIDAAKRRSRVASLGAIVATLALVTPSARSESPDAMSLLVREASHSQRIVFQHEWAIHLATVLGLSPVLSEQTSPTEVFGLLCAEQVERSIEAGGRQLPLGSAYRVVVDAPRGRGPQDPVRIVVSLPAPAIYMLSVEGTGLQRWSVNRRPVGHFDPSALGVAQGTVVLPLRGGPHEISGILGRSSRVDRVELAAYRPLCIAPSRGWSLERPLTYADKARTLVAALGIEQRLPAAGEPVLIEAESFVDSSAWGARTNRALGDEEFSGMWVTALGSPAEFTYRFRNAEPGVFSLDARLHGAGPQLWAVDGRYRVTVIPGEGSQEFAWTPVMTLSLPAGEHVIRALLPQDAGLDVIRVQPRKSGDGNYLTLIEEAGFWGGAPGAYVTRASAFHALSNPTLAEHANHFLDHLVDAEDPVFLVESNLDDLYAHPLSPVLPPEL